MIGSIRLYFITDSEDEAAMTLVGCRVASLPAWMKVLTDPVEVEHLPSDVEVVWQERKLRGGFDTDREKDIEKLNDCTTLASCPTPSVLNRCAKAAMPLQQEQETACRMHAWVSHGRMRIIQVKGLPA